MHVFQIKENNLKSTSVCPHRYIPQTNRSTRGMKSRVRVGITGSNGEREKHERKRWQRENTKEKRNRTRRAKRRKVMTPITLE